MEIAILHKLSLDLHIQHIWTCVGARNQILKRHGNKIISHLAKCRMTSASRWIEKSFNIWKKRKTDNSKMNKIKIWKWYLTLKNFADSKESCELWNLRDIEFVWDYGHSFWTQNFKRKLSDAQIVEIIELMNSCEWELSDI